jgi:hypothetical protein
MKKTAQLSIVLISSLFFVFLAGCEEQQQQTTSNPRQERLIADENMQLKNQLEQKDLEIQKRQDALDKCIAERDKLKEQSRQNMRESLEKMMGKMADKEQNIVEENKSLKAQVEELKKQLEKTAAPAAPAAPVE